MKFTITYIKAHKNIPLSRECLPINETHPLWPPPQGEDGSELRGAKYPAAFKIKKRKSIRLMVKIQIQNFTSGIYKLEGFEKGDCKTSIFSSKEINIEKPDPEIKVYDTPNSLNFHRFEGKIIWKLTRKGKATNKTQNDVTDGIYLEFFWLYGYNSKLFRFGVPVELLRHSANALRIGKESGAIPIVSSSKTSAAIEPLKDPVIMAIATACFFINPLRYDISGKDYYFVRIGRGINRIDFRLREYINAIHDSIALCNCYDMAAVVQVHLKAIGIKKVQFCYMDTFGYMRLSKLIGRGLCNNPTYICRPDGTLDQNLVVDENYKKREKFSSHAFCCLPQVEKSADEGSCHGNSKPGRSSYRVLDACIGPHIGNDNFDEYRTKILDTDTPEGARLPEPSIKIYNGVISTDYIKGKGVEPTLPYTDAFKTEVNYSQKVAPGDKFFLVYSLPNPREFLALVSGWDILFEQIVPGTHEIMKTWKLKKKCNKIQVDVYVFSDKKAPEAVKAARYRFLALGSLSTHQTLLLENWPSGPGRYSAKYETKEYNKYLWTKFNTTVSITCQNTSLDVDAVCMWINNFVLNKKNVKSSIDDYLPSSKELRYKGEIETGETVDVELGSQENVFIDFDFEGLNSDDDGGIHLISKEDKKLTFSGVKKSINKLTIVIVNKDTLLTNSKKITIEVLQPK